MTLISNPLFVAIERCEMARRPSVKAFLPNGDATGNARPQSPRCNTSFHLCARRMKNSKEHHPMRAANATPFPPPECMRRRGVAVLFAAAQMADTGGPPRANVVASARDLTRHLCLCVCVCVYKKAGLLSHCGASVRTPARRRRKTDKPTLNLFLIFGGLIRARYRYRQEGRGGYSCGACRLPNRVITWNVTPLWRCVCVLCCVSIYVIFLFHAPLVLSPPPRYLPVLGTKVGEV